MPSSSAGHLAQKLVAGTSPPHRTGWLPDFPSWPTYPHVTFACADPGSKEYAALDRPGKEAALQAAVAAYETATAQAEATAKVGL